MIHGISLKKQQQVLMSQVLYILHQHDHVYCGKRKIDISTVKFHYVWKNKLEMQQNITKKTCISVNMMI